MAFRWLFLLGFASLGDFGLGIVLGLLAGTGSSKTVVVTLGIASWSVSSFAL